MFDPKQMMMQTIMGRMTQNPLTQQVLQMKQQGMTPQQAAAAGREPDADRSNGGECHEADGD